METFTDQWPWKTQEKLTLVLLPVLAFVPAFIALASGEPVGGPKLVLAGAGVFFTALLGWTAYSRKVKSQVVATLDGDILTVSSNRHGESVGDLSRILVARTFQHTVTLEDVLSVRTAGGELRIPTRLLDGSPDLAVIVTAAAARPRVNVPAEDLQ